MKERPTHLNLFKIKLPISGVLSILHRVSGFLMALTLPLIVWLFGVSIKGESGFTQSLQILSHTLSKITMAVLAWSFLHHVLSGIRFLLIDVGLGVKRTKARASAHVISGTSMLSLLIFLGYALL